MEFRFDADQEFQVKAIEAVADLLDGRLLFVAQEVDAAPGGSAGRVGQAPQHFLYFFPLPQGQGSFRPILGGALMGRGGLG